MRNIFARLSNRVAAVSLGGAIVLAGSALAFTTKPAAKLVALNIPVDERPVARELGGRNSFAPVVKKVGPAVVKVFTTTKMHNTAYSGPPGMDDFLRRFFGDDFDGREGRNPRRNFNVPRQQGIGSGVIATKDGFILTN